MNQDESDPNQFGSIRTWIVPEFLLKVHEQLCVNMYEVPVQFKDTYTFQISETNMSLKVFDKAIYKY